MAGRRAERAAEIQILNRIAPMPPLKPDGGVASGAGSH
jgi:hypothetical protein